MNAVSALRSVAIAASFVAASSAFAADVTTSSQGYEITASTGALTYSSTISSILPQVGVTISPLSPSTYTSPVLSIPVGTFSYDSGSNAVTGVTTLGGSSFTIGATFLGGPGTISLSNLKLDVTGKQIFADVTGGNGVVSNNYAFFNVGSLTGDTTFHGAGDYSLKASTLTLTSDGLSLLTKGLAIPAAASIISAADFGTLSTTTSIGVTSAVPEPSMFGLTLAGMVGIALAKRRRKQ